MKRIKISEGLHLIVDNRGKQELIEDGERELKDCLDKALFAKSCDESEVIKARAVAVYRRVIRVLQSKDN